MMKNYSRLGRMAGRYLLVAGMAGVLAGCGSSGGDGEVDTDVVAIGDQDADGDGIINSLDNDADGDGIDDFDGDNFVDLDGDGLDDVTLLTEAQSEASGDACNGEGGTDGSSVNNTWSDNCLVKRSLFGGKFADSLYSVGIQRVLYCSGFASSIDFPVYGSYRDFADGEYGPNSEKAAKAFQVAEGLIDDGIIGPQTWSRLQQRIELLTAGTPGSTPDIYGFSSGLCADIPMFYQTVSVGGVLGEWRLARNEPNESQSIPLSIDKPFGVL